MNSVRVLTSEELAAAGLRQAVIELCVAAHEEDAFRQMFTEYFPSGARHFLAYDGETLVSHAVVTARGVQPEGLPILRPLAGRSNDGLIPTPDQRGVMVLRLPNTPPLDLDAVLTIECQPDRIWE